MKAEFFHSGRSFLHSFDPREKLFEFGIGGCIQSCRGFCKNSRVDIRNCHNVRLANLPEGFTMLLANIPQTNDTDI